MIDMAANLLEPRLMERFGSSLIWCVEQGGSSSTTMTFCLAMRLWMHSSVTPSSKQLMYMLTDVCSFHCYYNVTHWILDYSSWIRVMEISHFGSLLNDWRLPPKHSPLRHCPHSRPKRFEARSHGVDKISLSVAVGFVGTNSGWLTLPKFLIRWRWSAEERLRKV